MALEHTGVVGRNLVCSWSGGKDSTLALHRALEAGGRIQTLLTMMVEDGARSRSHGLPVEVIRAQTDALHAPVRTCATSWANYENTFVTALRSIREEGVELGVFGDIDGEPNREWEQKVCNAAGLRACLPLWQQDRRRLLDEFILLGYRAVVVAVNGEQLSRSYLGRMLDDELVRKLAAEGIDPSGENGEYHTVVIGGPIFNEEIHLEFRGQELHDGYWFQDVTVPHT